MTWNTRSGVVGEQACTTQSAGQEVQVSPLSRKPFPHTAGELDGVDVAVGVEVAAPTVGVSVAVGVALGVELAASEGVIVGLALGATVEVALGDRVALEVAVDDAVGVGVSVMGNVLVAATLGVAVGVALSVRVAVSVGRGVQVAVDVRVAVDVWTRIGGRVCVAVGRVPLSVGVLVRSPGVKLTDLSEPQPTSSAALIIVAANSGTETRMVMTPAL